MLENEDQKALSQHLRAKSKCVLRDFRAKLFAPILPLPSIFQKQGFLGGIAIDNQLLIKGQTVL